jgi:hypothetical protein
MLVSSRKTTRCHKPEELDLNFYMRFICKMRLLYSLCIALTKRS